MREVATISRSAQKRLRHTLVGRHYDLSIIPRKHPVTSAFHKKPTVA
jgi:hypothetical protein